MCAEDLVAPPDAVSGPIINAAPLRLDVRGAGDLSTPTTMPWPVNAAKVQNGRSNFALLYHGSAIDFDTRE